MAGSRSARSQKRFSVRAATEPLPAPLPPPLRLCDGNEPAAKAAELHAAHQTPPSPCFSQSENGFVERRLGSDHESTLDRSLRSPSVLAALAASGILLATLGWFQMSEGGDLRWRSVKSFVADKIIEGASDSDLPYITDSPLVPTHNPRGMVVEQEKRPPSNKAERVTLGDVTFTDSPGAAATKETQRR